MHCDEALPELGRLIDGEAALPDRAALIEHLAHCERCSAACDEMRAADAALLRAFMPRRRAAASVADRVIEQLRNERGRQRRVGLWSLALVSAAAGFLLAVVLFWPDSNPQRPTAAVPLARLALATGLTEVRPAAAVPWFGCPTNSKIERGSCVRTSDASRCEIEANDGTQIRLDAGTVIELPNPRCVRLSQGELYSAIPGVEQFKIELPDAVVEATGGKFDVSCSPGESSLTVIEGSASVSCKSGTQRVAAGEYVRLVGGQINESSTVADPLQATAWVNELLLLKGPENPELIERLNDILAQIGHAKLSYLYEDEIRRLGSRAALPLLRFVASPRSRSDEVSRVAAARIAADLADETVIGDLIALLANNDALVRFHATRALKRLAGADYGVPADGAEQDSDTFDATREGWETWWQTR